MNGSGAFKWTKDYLVNLLMTGRNPILTDPMLINAFTQIDRKHFVPETLANKAYNDLELDIGFNEKLSRPTIIAQMIAMLKPKLGGKYMDIGAGTGYSTAIIAFVTGESGKVYSIERVQWLWEQARYNLQKYPNLQRAIQLVYKDGIEGLVNQAPFDGIHIAFALDVIPESLLMQLNMNGGRLVAPTSNNYLKVIQRNGQNDYEEELIPGFSFSGYKQGMA